MTEKQKDIILVFIKKTKNRVVRNQNYEYAAYIRDVERNLENNYLILDVKLILDLTEKVIKKHSLYQSEILNELHIIKTQTLRYYIIKKNIDYLLGE